MVNIDGSRVMVASSCTSYKLFLVVALNKSMCRCDGVDNFMAGCTSLVIWREFLTSALICRRRLHAMVIDFTSKQEIYQVVFLSLSWIGSCTGCELKEF
jgi:hypothetical protein